MRKLLFATLSFGLLMSCSSINYKINGTLPNNDLTGEMAYLVNYDSQDTIDSVMIRGNAVTFQGKIEKPIMARVLFGGRPQSTFILENGDINIDFAKRDVTGGQLNEALNTMKSKEDSIENSYMAIAKDSTSNEITVEKAEDAMNASLLNLYKDTYQQNKNNPLGYYAYLQYTYDFTLAQQDSIRKELSEDFLAMKRVQRWYDGAKNKEKSAVGKKYLDFTIKSEDGVETSLSDLVGTGHYTLVDFWASWCGPCIRETKVIKEILNEYGPKGLQVVGVAVWDEPQNTRKAIAQHQLTWPQIFNAQSIPTDLYGITGIPHIMIIGPDGTILSRGLQGNKLKMKVAEIMNNAEAK